MKKDLKITTTIAVVLALLVASCGGGGSSSQGPSPTVVELSLPTFDAVKDASIVEKSDPPAAPEGFTLAGKVYEISVPDSTIFPVRVAIPASEDIINNAQNQQILMGRHNGTDWDLLPAALVDGKVIANIDHFTPIGVFFRPLDEGARADQYYSGLHVKAPSLNWLSVEGNEIYAEINLLESTLATDTRIDAEEKHPAIDVRGLKLYFSIPITTQSGSPNPRDEHFKEFKIDEEDFIDLSALSYKEKIAYKFKIGPTDFFDSTNILSYLDGNSQASFGSWLMKVKPVFGFGNVVGKLTEGVSSATPIPVGVADTYLKMRQGMINQLPQNHAESFAANSNSTPLLLPYDKGWNQVYSNPLTWDNAALLALSGVYYPLIGLDSQESGWVRVVTHEWGHFATHMLLGDAWTKAVATGNHVGWKEADSRELAWAEDLATFIGQWTVHENLNGLPSNSGAMAGKISQDDLSHYSRFPEGAGDASDLNTYWPNNLEMDVAKVESVTATILSRLSQEYSFSSVISLIADSRATTFSDFIDAWLFKYGHASNEALFLQETCIDEKLTWQVKGKVIDALTSLPLNKVDVVLEHDAGNLSLASVKTDSEGIFTAILPPGKVNMSLSLNGYTSLKDKTVEIENTFPTTAGRYHAPDIILNNLGLTNLPLGNAAFEIEDHFAFKLSRKRCGDYEVYLDGACKNYYPQELPSQTTIESIMSEEVICPITKPQNSGGRLDIPSDTDYTGEYTVCRYLSGEDNAVIASQVHYNNKVRIGVELYFTQEGDIRNYVRETEEQGAFISVWIDEDRLPTQVTHIRESDNMSLITYFASNGLWSYDYSLGEYGKDSAVFVQFDDKLVTTLFIFGPNKNMEKDLRFENGIITSCTLRDGNTILGSCL